jgi:hypothetical protein
MRNSVQAPTIAVWLLCFLLYLIALAAQFDVVQVGEAIATWSWVIGLGLLLLACRVKGL